jgi:hypothetical protein
MSDDPSRPEDFPPDRPEAGVPYERPAYEDAGRSVDAVRRRVQLPAIFLIVVTVLNFLYVIYQGVNVAFVASTPAKELKEAQVKVFKDLSPQFSQYITQTSAEDLWTQSLVIGCVIVAVHLLCSLLILLGSIQMLRFRSYGLAVTASILAAIPCITCSACCGVGEGIGIWALVVLMNPEVRAAFAAMR